MLIKHRYKVKGMPFSTKKYIEDMVEKLPLLKEWHVRGGEPDIEWSNDTGYEGNYSVHSKKILIAKIWNQTNYRLISTTFHELWHAYQDVSGIYNFAIEQFGSGKKSEAFLELQAYNVQVSFGDNAAKSHFTKYFNLFNYLNQNTFSK